MQYNLEIELSVRWGSHITWQTSAIDEVIEELVDALRDFHASVGCAESGRIQVTISLEAQSIEHACGLGWTLIHEVWPGMIKRFEVLPTADYDLRYGIGA